MRRERFHQSIILKWMKFNFHQFVSFEQKNENSMKKDQLLAL